ncbi:MULTISPECIES: DUF4349 domain-containing protein [Chryseobacterium]|uniref:DUF4349 domain-containing protein n=1 Tax=Chryseobacterium TaxID=59732 RepID=UPI00195DA7B7|nr:MULTISPECIES: DUF4349 domain-containing protein [Chryseobacterium]MBM7420977.1 hypothetical protein [Chryseobacterium sp. JUb44]MDH6210935.1 hypothetical protein [Chryseobacterium sp. BIGb0186]WSO09602.1 DUF4349 domain-containing protein [Chryseobacterium scophthalmum]
MKKFIVLIAVSSVFVMCKKGEATQPQVENAISSADSAVANISEKINSVNNEAEAVFDSASIKIKDFEKTKSEAVQKMEATSKSIDSLSEKIGSMKLESKSEKKDSLHKIVVNVPAPKVIKETKIVYKDRPKPVEKVSQNIMQKTGVLELNVTDTETAKETVKELVKKYDGFVKSENTSLNNNDIKIAYLKVKVPIQKFDYLMDDLSFNIGNVENKGIDVNGKDFVNNTLCDMEITLYGTSEAALVNSKPETFGGKSLAAISSGWEVITSIFLFILPLWPLFVMAGIGYYFYKKKNNKQSENQSN